MVRCFCLLLLGLVSTTVWAEDRSTSPAQLYLSSGEFIRGETELAVHLDTHPADDEARFGLGLIQFLRAIENLGQTQYEYGVRADRLSEPFPRLPIPLNDHPTTLSYEELRRVLEVFVADLSRAEETLAKITSADVKLKLLLAPISFDFTKSGQQRVTLSEILKRMNRGVPLFQQENKDIRIHFDRGDVAWLRAYCHMLMSMAEVSLAADLSPGFNTWMGRAYPKLEITSDAQADVENVRWVKIDDATHLRRFRLHLVAVCELNRDTWKYIRQETDDDYEWLSHPKQKDQLGLPISDQQISAWLRAMAQFEELLKGERLMPGALIRIIISNFPEGQGLNVKKLFDDPPSDLFNFDRIEEKGVDAKYLEAEAGRKLFDLQMLMELLKLYNGPFGFAQAARMN